MELGISVSIQELTLSEMTMLYCVSHQQRKGYLVNCQNKICCRNLKKASIKISTHPTFWMQKESRSSSLTIFDWCPPMNSHEMSNFCITLHEGHLDMMQRIYGYLSKMPNATLRVQTEETYYFLQGRIFKMHQQTCGIISSLC